MYRLRLINIQIDKCIYRYIDISVAINIKYLQNSKDKSILKSSTCLNILFLPVNYFGEYNFFWMIDVVLECESQVYANP